MNVIIISTAFFESTLPLFKELSTNYSNANFKLVALINNSFLNLPGFDLTSYKNILKQPGNYQLSNLLNKKEDPLYDYLNIISQNIFVLSYNEFKKKALIHDCNLLKESDVIHFIGLNPLYEIVIKYLKNNNHCPKIIWSLHETDPSRDFKSYPILKMLYYTFTHRRMFNLIKQTHTITFFSNHQLLFFKNKYPNSVDLHLIKFGLFDYFKTLKNNTYDIFKLPKDYILFVGMIKPYKGVENLINLIKKTSELCKYNFVFAGKDYIGIDKQILPKNITVVNKYLIDKELVLLIKNAKCIILPYINASQSGIPSISFLFRIPILYTEVDGLNDYLEHNYNGLSFNLGECDSLTKALCLMHNERIYNNLQLNIEIKPFKFKYKWEDIAAQFLNLYQIK